MVQRDGRDMFGSGSREMKSCVLDSVSERFLFKGWCLRDQGKEKLEVLGRKLGQILGPGLPGESSLGSTLLPVTPTVSIATSSSFARQLLCLCVHVHVLVSFSAFPAPRSWAYLFYTR